MVDNFVSIGVAKKDDLLNCKTLIMVYGSAASYCLSKVN